MAGGIFVNQPFHPNIKCIIFSLILMISYWILPYRNPFILPLIFVFSYVGMAWYDHMYNCDLKMYGGKYGGYLSSPFKPQRRNQESPDKNLLKNQESKYNQKVNLLHIIAINPVIIYIGLYGNKSNPQLYPVLLIIGIIALLYHGGRIFVDREVIDCKNANEKDIKNYISQLKTVYIMHLVAIVPLFLYVGIRGKKSDNRVFPILLAMGIISDIYHIFRIFSPKTHLKC